MPKMKTSRATAKRLRRTGTGKVVRKHAGARHHLGIKPRKRKRRLHASSVAESTERGHLKKLLPYSG